MGELRFPFDGQKAIEVTSIILKNRANWERPQNDIGRLRLMKLLFLIEQEAILQTGYGIIGGQFSAMENGPVTSEVYSAITSVCDWARGGFEKMWSKFFRNGGQRNLRISMIGQPIDPENLLDVEIEIINEVWNKYKYTRTSGRNGLRGITHTMPAWRKSEPPKGSSKVMNLEDIFEGKPNSEELVEAACENARCSFPLEELFG